MTLHMNDDQLQSVGEYFENSVKNICRENRELLFDQYNQRDQIRNTNHKNYLDLIETQLDLNIKAVEILHKEQDPKVQSNLLQYLTSALLNMKNDLHKLK